MTDETLRQQFEADDPIGMSATPTEYAKWLESRLIAAEQEKEQAFNAAREYEAAMFKYPTYQDYATRDNVEQSKTK